MFGVLLIGIASWHDVGGHAIEVALRAVASLGFWVSIAALMGAIFGAREGEYPERLREVLPRFLDLCRTPELAAKITLQPVTRLGVDAAILFSDIVVPLRARGRVLGALTLIGIGAGRHFGEADLRLAEDLGRRAGLAVDNARSYEREWPRPSSATCCPTARPSCPASSRPCATCPAAPG